MSNSSKQRFILSSKGGWIFDADDNLVALFERARRSYRHTHDEFFLISNLEELSIRVRDTDDLKGQEQLLSLNRRVTFAKYTPLVLALLISSTLMLLGLNKSALVNSAEQKPVTPAGLDRTR
jgi:hypothetical protein